MNELRLLDIVQHKLFFWSKKDLQQVKTSMKSVIMDVTAREVEVHKESNLHNAAKLFYHRYAIYKKGKDQFVEKYVLLLENTIVIHYSDVSCREKIVQKRGAYKKRSYKNLGKRDKQLRVKTILEGDADELSAAADRLHTTTKKNNDDNDGFTLLCLALVKKARLSRSQYLDIRYFLKECCSRKYDVNIAPSWITLRRKIEECWPADITQSNCEMEVSLHSLLKHTAIRTLERPDVVHKVNNGDLISYIVTRAELASSLVRADRS